MENEKSQLEKAEEIRKLYYSDFGKRRKQEAKKLKVGCKEKIEIYHKNGKKRLIICGNKYKNLAKNLIEKRYGYSLCLDCQRIGEIKEEIANE